MIFVHAHIVSVFQQTLLALDWESYGHSATTNDERAFRLQITLEALQ